VSFVRTCPHCGKRNRVPARHLASKGRCGACKQTLPPLSEPLDVDAGQFDEVIRDAAVPVLVDFWAPWCGPCKMAAPEVARAAGDLAGQALVLKVDTDRHPDLSGRYGVRSIPYFVIFRDGSPRWQHAGLLRAPQLTSAILEEA
jgi:thioredoxin 2